MPLGANFADKQLGRPVPRSYFARYAFNSQFQGAELIAKEYGITREETDRFGLRSRAAELYPGLFKPGANVYWTVLSDDERNEIVKLQAAAQERVGFTSGTPKFFIDDFQPVNDRPAGGDGVTTDTLETSPWEITESDRGYLQRKSNFKKRQRAMAAFLRPFLVYGGVDRLHQRAFAHPARTPEQGVVGGKAVGEAAGIVEQNVALPVDPAQQPDIHAIDLRHGDQAVAILLPDESIGGIQVAAQGQGRCEPFQRVGDAGKQGNQIRSVHGRGP